MDGRDDEASDEAVRFWATFSGAEKRFSSSGSVRRGKRGEDSECLDERKGNRGTDMFDVVGAMVSAGAVVSAGVMSGGESGRPSP